MPQIYSAPVVTCETNAVKRHVAHTKGRLAHNHKAESRLSTTLVVSTKCHGATAVMAFIPQRSARTTAGGVDNMKTHRCVSGGGSSRPVTVEGATAKGLAVAVSSAASVPLVGGTRGRRPRGVCMVIETAYALIGRVKTYTV